MPALYPANPCILGPSWLSGHELNFGTGLGALLRGEYPLDPLFGLLGAAIFLAPWGCVASLSALYPPFLCSTVSLASPISRANRDGGSPSE